MAWPWESPPQASSTTMMPDAMTLGMGAAVLFVLVYLFKPAPKPSRIPYFSPYDLVVNAAAPFAIPFLVSLNPIFKPLYKLTDAILFKSNRKPGGPSNTCNPVVIFCSRTVKSVAAYKTAWVKYAEAAQKGGPGVRAIFSFVDRDQPNVILQFMWCDTAADYPTPPAAVSNCYDSASGSDYCQIWGSWDDALKQKLSTTPGLKCGFVKDMRGFIKDPVASFPGKRGFDTGVTPMIWISKRNVKPGRMPMCGKHFQLGTDLMFRNAPAALGICEYTSAEDPDALWSLRIFNDFASGFKAHFPVPSFILFRMVWNVIPEWKPGLFPIGFSFSTKAYIDAAVASNPGNKSYKQYHFDGGDLLGPMPDFGKGFSPASSPSESSPPAKASPTRRQSTSPKRRAP